MSEAETRDSLGWRCKFGVVAPSTNTVVQPDYEQLRIEGVTNHHSRAVIPNTSVSSDEDFLVLLNNVRGATAAAVEAVMTCEPDYLILGMSAETFWDGPEGADEFAQRLSVSAGVSVTLGSTAVLRALDVLGGIRRIGVITPYMPVGDERVYQFFEQSGVAVRSLVGLKCASPVKIAHVDTKTLRDSIARVDGSEVEAIIQVGTNLSMMSLAAQAEQELGKPVIAINAATYWHALRECGIRDSITGFGRLLADY